MKWSLGSQPVGGSFSARVPRSSAEVRRVFIHDIKEDEVDGQKEEQVTREKMRKWKCMEMSKRLEATLTVRMNHEDDHGMNGDSNLSQTVCVHLNKENSQGTTTLTDNKK